MGSLFWPLIDQRYKLIARLLHNVSDPNKTIHQGYPVFALHHRIVNPRLANFQKLREAKLKIE